MATPTVLSFTMQDNDGVKASAPFYASYDGALETVDALVGEWLALGAIVDTVTGAKIISGSITIPLARDGSWKSAPIAGQSVSDALNLNFSNDDDIKAFGETVPAVRDTLIVSGRPNIATGGIANLIAHLTAGFTNGFYVNTGGSNLIALIDAFQGVRKHRRQLRAKSLVTP